MLLLATKTASAMVSAAFSVSHYSNVARGSVRWVNIMMLLNKHLFLMVACAVFRRIAAGQRVISLEHSLCLIKNQTGFLTQKTPPHFLFISHVSPKSTLASKGGGRPEAA